MLRTKDITRCDTSDANDYSRRLMRREGLWKSVPGWVRNLPVGGWPELVAGLVGKVVILEDEASGGFYIGPILEAQAKHAAIHYLDGCGRLRDVDRVPYSRINSMLFGERYSTIHAKHLTSGGRAITSTDPDDHHPKRNR